MNVKNIRAKCLGALKIRKVQLNKCYNNDYRLTKGTQSIITNTCSEQTTKIQIYEPKTT